MNGAPSIVHEIYVKKKSAGWQLHAAYTLREAKKSLVDAAELFSSGRFEAVRVVKETYDAAHNIAHEEEVYHSPDRAESKLSRPTMARPAPSMPRNPPARTSAQATARPGPRRKPDAKGGAGKVAVVGFVSLGGAALIIYALLALFRRLSGMTISLDDAGSQSVIVSVFMIGFVSIFILLMKCFGLSLREILSAAPSDDVGTTPKASSTLTAIRNVSAAPPDHPIGAMGPPEGIKEDFGGQTEGQAQAQTQAQNQAQGQTQAQVHASLGEEHSQADHSKEEAEAENATPLGEAAESVSADLLEFIGESLEPLVAAGRRLDAFNRFGLTLYFAGAGEYLASCQQLSDKEIQDILCTHARLLGHSPEMARRFCGNVDEYLVSPKYFRMYEAGRAAMARRQQEPDGEPGVVEAMDFWNRPFAPTVKHVNEFVAVLFTDIVGSTAETQERTDNAAVHVVQEHDAIVRAALALHGGREIKHTGDGIMATFPQIVSAVDGAIAMQQACERANAADASLGLGLCIGVNAGEPIHERGDVFGTPVQMAARVLTKAEGHEIAVSNLVREMCVGKQYAFTKKGDYELKGFSEPVPIYLLDWQSDADAPDGDAPNGDAPAD